MSTELVTAKSARLAKTSRPVIQMDARLAHARELFNAALKRAEADYYERVRRAVNAATGIEESIHDAPAETVSTPAAPGEATA